MGAESTGPHIVEMGGRAVVSSNVINGVNVIELKRKAGILKQDPPKAKFEFRVRNRWLGCGR